ncbi:acetyltransferase [Bdellovibrio sp. 22V]|uniref:acetyltransferase n=1 Tax=Bdellovibrio sp. 22V TaxID=3044166 RepID=UPI002542A539|nr:acetyltransferase [Bdellovibrio sp. 22V]WII71812.1 acetyltransferase [Bdellovibrio sp. 22V]
MKKQILVVGAGGHSKVVTEIVNMSSEWEIVAYLDEQPKADLFLGKPVFTSLESLKFHFPAVRFAFVAIGQNNIRKLWHESLEKNDYNLPWLKHPTAEVSASAQIGSGTLIAAKSFVGPDAKVGRGVIVNTAAILDHDSSIGDFSHLSQGAIACGGAQISAEVLIGPGCILEKMAVASATTPANDVVTAQ